MKKLIALLAVLSFPALAAPIAVAVNSGISVTVFDEPCAIPGMMLPYRATWTEAGNRFEGCFGAFLDGAALGFLFEDGSMAVVPTAAFKPVTAL